jgi:hypothetical protein
MANLLSVQAQRGIGPRYTLSDGFTETDGEISFCYFTRNTTAPTGSTDLDGLPDETAVVATDVIYACRLPKGARILFGRLFTEALGASVTIGVGIPGTPGAYLATTTDVSAASASELAATYLLGAGSVIAADTWLILTLGASGTVAANKVISGYIAYAAH